MRLATIEALPDSRVSLVVTDSLNEAYRTEFNTWGLAESFLLRAGWVWDRVPGKWSEPAFWPEPFTAIPLPYAADTRMRREVMEASAFGLAAYVFSVSLLDSPESQFGFHYLPNPGLAKFSVNRKADPVLSLLAPEPLRIEAVGYWPTLDAASMAAQQLFAQLEVHYGPELFRAALRQNILRILSTTP